MEDTTGSPTLAIRCYQAEDEAQVIDLWQRCQLVVPWNNLHRDIALKLAAQPDLFFVGVAAGQIVTTVMAGYDGHRGWINYLAVAPEQQGHGVGQQIMARAEAELRARGCPKINLQVRSSNSAVIAFYEQIGFTIDDVVSLGKRL